MAIVGCHGCLGFACHCHKRGVAILVAVPPVAECVIRRHGRIHVKSNREVLEGPSQQAHPCTNQAPTRHSARAHVDPGTSKPYMTYPGSVFHLQTSRYLVCNGASRNQLDTVQCAMHSVCETNGLPAAAVDVAVMSGVDVSDRTCQFIPT